MTAQADNCSSLIFENTDPHSRICKIFQDFWKVFLYIRLYRVEFHNFSECLVAVSLKVINSNNFVYKNFQHKHKLLLINKEKKIRYN